MNAERATYLDSSAILKLVVTEPESGALRDYLAGRVPLVSSAIARVEVLRHAHRQDAEAVDKARAVLGAIELLEVDDAILGEAAIVLPRTLRTLDALHVAAALSLGSVLETLVAYDVRLQEAARSAGLVVVAPA